MKEVDVTFGRKVKTAEYENATFEITAKIETDGTDASAKIPELFTRLENEVEKEIAKFKEGLKQIPASQTAPAAPTPVTTVAKRKESDLPVNCAVKSNGTGEDKKILFYIDGDRVFNPGKAIIGKITPAENTIGTYYKFSIDKSLILSKAQSGNWLLKKRNVDGKYEVAGHVSTNFGTEK